MSHPEREGYNHEEGHDRERRRDLSLTEGQIELLLVALDLDLHDTQDRLAALKARQSLSEQEIAELNMLGDHLAAVRDVRGLLIGHMNQ